MVISAALSIQDPRERPMEKQQASDEKHRRFYDKDSDYMAFVNLWTYIKEQRSALSSNQFRKMCQKEFLAYMRVREWQDIYAQIKQVVDELDIKINQQVADFDNIHQALLAGLLHDIGKLILFEIDKELTLKYFDNQARTTSDVELEKRIFSTDHSQIGGYLLHVWSFPYHIIDAVLLHHNPNKLLKQRFGIAQAVYLANALLKEQEPSLAFVKHYQLEEKLDKLKLKAQRFKS